MSRVYVRVTVFDAKMSEFTMPRGSVYKWTNSKGKKIRRRAAIGTRSHRANGSLPARAHHWRHATLTHHRPSPRPLRHLRPRGHGRQFRVPQVPRRSTRTEKRGQVDSGGEEPVAEGHEAGSPRSAGEPFPHSGHGQRHGDVGGQCPVGASGLTATLLVRTTGEAHARVHHLGQER